MFGVWLPAQQSISRTERETERKPGHNYICICWLDIDLIWLKNVNSNAY